MTAQNCKQKLNFLNPMSSNWSLIIWLNWKFNLEYFSSLVRSATYVAVSQPRGAKIWIFLGEKLSLNCWLISRRYAAYVARRLSGGLVLSIIKNSQCRSRFKRTSHKNWQTSKSPSSSTEKVDQRKKKCSY